MCTLYSVFSDQKAGSRQTVHGYLREPAVEKYYSQQVCSHYARVFSEISQCISSYSVCLISYGKDLLEGMIFTAKESIKKIYYYIETVQSKRLSFTSESWLFIMAIPDSLFSI